MKKVCVRLEQPIQDSKYAEIVNEMAKRNIGKPITYSTVLSNGSIATITFHPENFNSTTAVLSDLDIQFRGL